VRPSGGVLIRPDGYVQIREALRLSQD
jgi:hypothetical protein